MEFDLSRSSASKAMARARRWTAPGKARVDHPKYGSVIVPCCSKLGAIENAAEFWRCDPMEISRAAEVWAVEPDAGPVRRPKEFYRKD